MVASAYPIRRSGCKGESHFKVPEQHDDSNEQPSKNSRPKHPPSPCTYSPLAHFPQPGTSRRPNHPPLPSPAAVDPDPTRGIQMPTIHSSSPLHSRQPFASSTPALPEQPTPTAAGSPAAPRPKQAAVGLLVGQVPHITPNVQQDVPKLPPAQEHPAQLHLSRTPRGSGRSNPHHHGRRLTAARLGEEERYRKPEFPPAGRHILGMSPGVAATSDGTTSFPCGLRSAQVVWVQTWSVSTTWSPWHDCRCGCVRGAGDVCNIRGGAVGGWRLEMSTARATAFVL